MANIIKVAKIQSIRTLLELGWSQRRIAKELLVNRETVARYARLADRTDSNPANPPTGSDGGFAPNPAIVPPGSAAGRRSQCEPLAEVIAAKLQSGLSGKRVWQDLTADHGFTGGYDAVKVKSADWFDPELNPKIMEFARHYGTVFLPAKPYTPRHKGKVESGIKYVKNNALKGRSFGSLAEMNAHLRQWERTVADVRIHGTAKKQVRQMFDLERKALLPLPAEPFPLYHEGKRRVHRDGHVEVARSYYSVPPEYLGRDVWVRWDSRLVRVFNDRFEQIAVHILGGPGRFSTAREHIASGKISGVERGAEYLLAKASRIGSGAGDWARAMLESRGIEGIRVLQGLVSLAGKYPAGSINTASRKALASRCFYLKPLRRLCAEESELRQIEFAEEHDLIRPLAEAFNKTGKAMAKYLKPDLLIIDDMGLKRLPKQSGEYLFEIIMRRFETRSTMMTSNRPLEEWGKLIGDVPTATAILDRFLSRAELIQITGKSYRLKDKACEIKDENVKQEDQ